MDEEVVNFFHQPIKISLRLVADPQKEVVDGFFVDALFQRINAHLFVRVAYLPVTP